MIPTSDTLYKLENNMLFCYKTATEYGLPTDRCAIPKKRINGDSLLENSSVVHRFIGKVHSGYKKVLRVNPNLAYAPLSSYSVDTMYNIALVLTDYEVVTLKRTCSTMYSFITAAERNNEYWHARTRKAIRPCPSDAEITTWKWKEVYEFIAKGGKYSIHSLSLCDTEVANVLVKLSAARSLPIKDTTLMFDGTLDFVHTMLDTYQNLWSVCDSMNNIFVCAVKNNVPLAVRLALSWPRNLMNALKEGVHVAALLKCTPVIEACPVYEYLNDRSVDDILFNRGRGAGSILLCARRGLVNPAGMTRIMFCSIRAENLELVKEFVSTNADLESLGVVLSNCKNPEVLAFVLGKVRFTAMTLNYCLGNSVTYNNFTLLRMLLDTDLYSNMGYVHAILGAVEKEDLTAAMMIISHPSTDVCAENNAILRHALKHCAYPVVNTIMQSRAFKECVSV